MGKGNVEMDIRVLVFFLKKKIDKGVLETYYDMITYQCVDDVLVSVMVSKLILELCDTLCSGSSISTELHTTLRDTVFKIIF